MLCRRDERAIGIPRLRQRLRWRSQPISSGRSGLHASTGHHRRSRSGGLQSSFPSLRNPRLMLRSGSTVSSSQNRRVSCFGRSRLLSLREAWKSVGYLDQLSQRPCAHLFHYMCAVSLYRQFADAEFGSDLFVEQARDNQAQNFLLPRTERVKALAKLSYFRAFLASGAVAGDRSLNSVQQILSTEWLGQKLHRACLHRFDRHGNVAKAGDEDDGNVDVRCAQLAL